MGIHELRRKFLREEEKEEMKQGQLKRVMVFGGLVVGIGLTGCSQKETLEIQTHVETATVRVNDGLLPLTHEVSSEEAMGSFDEESMNQLLERLSEYPVLETSIESGVQIILDGSVLEGFESIEVGMVTFAERIISEYLSVKGCLSSPYLIIQFKEAGMVQLTANELSTIDWTNQNEVTNALVTATMLYGENLSK